MTDIEVSYYDGEQWQELTDCLKAFHIENFGVNRVTQATVNFFQNATVNIV